MRIRTLMLSLLSVFAFSAVAVTVAQAHTDFGPYYKVEGLAGTERLLGGASQGIEAKSVGSQVLKTATATITCTGEELKNGQLEGSRGENSSRSSGTLKYSGCTVTGNGTPCEVTGGTIETKPVIGTLGYEGKSGAGEGEGKLLTIFEPETGTEFAEVKFTGTGCSVNPTKVKTKSPGKGIIAEDLNEAEAMVKVGLNETKGLFNFVNFPAAANEITKLWVETNGTLVEVKAGLEAFAIKATLEGKTKLETTGTPKKKWGVFAK